jgi:V8-like Glu-specific endopeptidase
VKPVILALALLAMCSSSVEAAIFGSDDRQPLLSSSVNRELGQAVAIAVLKGNSTFESSGKMNLTTTRLSSFVCRDERFSSDPSLSYSCTGFLVAPDLLVTAGHCMTNQGDVQNETGGYCGVYNWLFDFQSSSDGSTQLDQIPTDRIYACKKIIYAVQDEASPLRDFALVQLDQPVKGRTPLRLAHAPVGVGDSSTMIGFPLGTPMKYTNNAKVVFDNPKSASFLTNLDAFDGNSGSPVFNSSNEVTGILVSGTPDSIFVEDKANRCQRYNKCKDDGTGCMDPSMDKPKFNEYQAAGSAVQRIAPILELLENLKRN